MDIIKIDLSKVQYTSNMLPKIIHGVGNPKFLLVEIVHPDTKTYIIIKPL